MFALVAQQADYNRSTFLRPNNNNNNNNNNDDDDDDLKDKEYFDFGNISGVDSSIPDPSSIHDNNTTG